MKKNYYLPEIELISLNEMDVIATSFDAISEDEIGVNANSIFG